MPRRNTSRGIWKVIASLLLAYIAAVPRTSRAQGEASINGAVTDTTGAIIAGAVVKVKNVEIGAVREIVTDSAGRYDAPSLAVGKYEVSAEQAGFRTEVKTGITLTIGQRAEVNLMLAVGGVHQSNQRRGNCDADGRDDRRFFGSGRRVTGEGLAAQWPQLRSTADVESRRSQLHVAAGRRNRDIELRGRQYVLGLGPQAAGESLHSQNRGIAGLGSQITRREGPGRLWEQTRCADFRRQDVRHCDAKLPGHMHFCQPGTNQPTVTSPFLRNSALEQASDQPQIPHFERNVFGGSLGGPIEKNKTFLFD